MASYDGVVSLETVVKRVRHMWSHSAENRRAGMRECIMMALAEYRFPSQQAYKDIVSDVARAFQKKSVEARKKSQNRRKRLKLPQPDAPRINPRAKTIPVTIDTKGQYSWDI